MKILIGMPNPKDWKKIKKLRLKALKTDPHAFISTYNAEARKNDDEWKKIIEAGLIEKPKELLTVAFDGNKIVGMIGACEKNKKFWDLKAVYVKPKYRQREIGKRMLRSLIEKIDSFETVKTIELMVNTKQEAAIRLYKGMGFKVFKLAKDQRLGDGKLHDEYIMRRTRK